MDGYTLTLAANPWNIVRTYNLTPGRELLFACRYRLGTASNLAERTERVTKFRKTLGKVVMEVFEARDPHCCG